MVLTDPNLSPRLRLAEVLNSRLEKEGYRFLKSKNEFVLDFEYGKKVIRLNYNGSMGYIAQVETFIYIVFNDIEKDFKKIIPNYGWTNWTLCRSIYWDSGWLCDENSGEYSNQSINDVAEQFFVESKPLIDLEFSKAKNYQDLKNLFLKKVEKEELVDGLRPEKKAILSLILCKIFEPKLFANRCNYIFDELNNYKELQDKSEILTEIKMGIDYLNSDKKLRTTTANKVYN